MTTNLPTSCKEDFLKIIKNFFYIDDSQEKKTMNLDAFTQQVGTLKEKDITFQDKLIDFLKSDKTLYYFLWIKFLSVSFPNFKFSNKTIKNIISFNILEAVFVDYLLNKDYFNTTLGLILIYCLKKNNSEVIKSLILWFFYYFLWNMRFCNNQKSTFISGLSHNLPALMTALTSKDYTNDEMLDIWMNRRAASILTKILPCL